MHQLKDLTQQQKSSLPEKSSANSEEPEPEILTPEEIADCTARALELARQAKRGRLALIAYQDEISKPKQYPTMSAEELLTNVIARGQETYGPGFILDQENKGVYQALCLYFAGDSRFEQIQPGFSLRKGLLLMGNVGCGKTSAMKLMQTNPHQSFAMVTCRQVAAEFAKGGKEGGHQAIAKYMNAIDNTMPNYFGHRSLGLCFDDLGTESSSAKSFGNELNVMVEILQGRYESAQCRGPMTHLTTNLSAEEINYRYGTRVRSRMREMFNQIEYAHTARDRRV